MTRHRFSEVSFNFQHTHIQTTHTCNGQWWGRWDKHHQGNICEVGTHDVVATKNSNAQTLALAESVSPNTVASENDISKQTKNSGKAAQLCQQVSYNKVCILNDQSEVKASAFPSRSFEHAIFDSA